MTSEERIYAEVVAGKQKLHIVSTIYHFAIQYQIFEVQ